MTDDPRSVTRRLLLLGNQMMALAGELASSRASPDTGHVGSDSSLSYRNDSNLWLMLAREFYQERRRRKKFFSSELFGEPAWDILLDLYIAAKENNEVSTTSACIGADVPHTTALRWLQLLIDQGLVERRNDKRDNRRTFVRISDLGYARMTEFFASNRMIFFRDDVLRKAEPIARDPANYDALYVEAADR